MPSGLPTLIPDTHAGGLGCRARRPLLRSHTISTFYSVLYPDTYGNASGVGRTPLQCVPQPPLAIPTRKDSHLIYVLHSEQVAIRHHPPTHRGKADGISTHGNLSSHVRDATFNALSGREDYSLRARRHTSSLHCTADNSIAFQSTKPRVARSICRVKERVSRLRRHPFARGRFTGDSTPCHTLPKQVRPTSFLFVDCPSIASPASPIRSEQCRHNALSTLIVHPPRAPIFGQPKH